MSEPVYRKKGQRSYIRIESRGYGRSNCRRCAVAWPRDEIEKVVGGTR